MKTLQLKKLSWNRFFFSQYTYKSVCLLALLE